MLDLLGEFVAGSSSGECAMAVGVVAAALPRRGGLDRAVDDLGAGRPVESRPRGMFALGDGRESMAEISVAAPASPKMVRTLRSRGWINFEYVSAVISNTRRAWPVSINPLAKLSP